MFKSIRTRLTLAFIVLAIGPILVVGLVLSTKGFSALKEEAILHQQMKAERVRMALEAYVGELEREMVLTSQAHSFMSLDRLEQRTILQELLSFEDRLEELVLLSSTGQELTRVHRTKVILEKSLGNRADQPAFLQSMALKGNYFGPVIFDPKTGEPQMTIAIPLHSFFTGKTMYVLTGLVRLKKIWDFLASVSDMDETVFIVDGQGNIVGHPDPSVTLSGRCFILPDQRAGIATGLDNDQVVLASEPIVLGQQTIFVVAQEPVSKALALADSLIRITLLVMLITLVIAILCSFPVVGAIIRPLQHLSSVSRKIQQGNLDQQVEYSGQDEVGELADAFNGMTSRLRSLIHSLEKEIKERQQAEAGVRRLQNLLNNIIDSMPSVIVSVDPQGKITQWNQEAEKATGIAASQATGHSLEEYYPRLAGELERVRDAIKNRVSHETRKIALVEKGETRFEDVTIYPLIANGVEGAVIRIDDVTNRVRIEEMMVQTEKMMSVGGLAAGMAHEINNPLGVMMHASQNVLRRISPELPANIRVAESCGISLAQVYDYLEKREILIFIEDIRSAGHRAAKIVDNMLQFSRKSESLRQLANLSKLIDKSLELAGNDYDLKKKYDFRHIEIVRHDQPGLPEVPVVASEIEQVLLNLLKNGAQAMSEYLGSDEAGSRSDPPPRFVISTAFEDTWARIEVADNGPGMNDEIKKRIFEPFFTTKPIGAGTGLGLSVSYMIITNNHKGLMEVESEPGKGAKFIIRLPLNRSEVLERSVTGAIG